MTADPWDTQFRFATRFSFRLVVRRLIACVVLGLLGLLLALLGSLVLSLFELKADWLVLALLAGVAAASVFTLTHSLRITTEDGILTKRLTIAGLPIRPRQLPFQTVEVHYHQPTLHSSDGPTESSGHYRVHAVMDGQRQTVLSPLETFLHGFESDRWEWQA
ncbi:hypothetical protein [Luteolibacter sp. LG18]|uniref:hypothetical protein n=1 Tax=Luteolibacter sp. LG18 TaxID=2819286 RepID=UPI002B2AF41B|nr:hypothetical protein llg_29280 [Luteolibacter sp. LG18]